MTPWSPAVLELLRTLLPSVTEQIVHAVSEEVAAYSGPVATGEGDFTEVVSLGVEQALARFLTLIDDPRAIEDETWRAPIVDLGRSAVRANRTLEALLAAYRVGARHAWREIAEAGSAAGVPPEELYRLAEELFLYIDELSALSAEGYSAERADRAGERQRLRGELAALLLREPAAERKAIEAAAKSAGWTVPASVAVVIATAENAERLAGLIGPDALASTAIEPAAVVVPDPDAPGRRATIRGAIEDAMPAALGPAVPVHDTFASAIRARHAVDLVGAGALPGDRLLICDEHLLTMLINRDERLLTDLRRRALAPLETLTPRVRTRLLATLVAFLEHEGRMDPTARALGVHPQTVRYRVAQLRDVLGSAMDDPEGRLTLQIAVRGRGD
jgi:hypothetical protein